MPDTSPMSHSKAVFLSYTSADTGIALAVCEALRDAGVEVWMDQSELQSGDAWDGNIRRQLKECALIIPIISARTQARREGYFRLEWKLADERMQLVAEGTPLILPVVADDTQQKDALVPKSFLTVQWSRLPHGNVPPAFALRVKKLLGLEYPPVSPSAPPFRANPKQPTEPSATLGSTQASDPVAINPEPEQSETVELMAPIEATKVARIAQTEARPVSKPRNRRLISAAITFALAIGIGALGAWHLKPSPKIEAKTITRFAHDIPPSISLRNQGRPTIAISPDGKAFVYNTASGLFIRKMDELEAHVIPGTEASLAFPVFSPDSQWIVFFRSTSPTTLSKISIHGGAVVKLCLTIGNLNGLSWSSEGTIIYADVDGSIYRVSENGGTPEKLIVASDEILTSPQILSGGKSVLFSSRKNADAVQVEVATLPKGERKVVIPGGVSPRYVAGTGHIIYVVDGTLFGAAFDLGKLTAIGSPTPLQTGIRLGLTGSSNLSLSDNGTLLYLKGGGAQMIFTWVDRSGREENLGIEPSNFGSFSISPDGKKLAFGESSNSATQSYYTTSVFNFETKTRTRITPSGSVGGNPLWSADGTKIFYDRRDGNIMLTSYNNTRPPEIIVTKITNINRLMPAFLSPDGVSLGFSTARPQPVGLSVGLSSASPGATTPPTWLFPNLKQASSPVLSPDGKWLAYISADSGTRELYVSPFPQVDGDRVQISTNQALSPLWSRNGKELFYMGGSKEINRRLMAAKVQSINDKFSVISIAPIWKTTLRASHYFADEILGHPFDISPDGERFLMLKDFIDENVGARSERVYIAENWTEELKRLVPTARK